MNRMIQRLDKNDAIEQTVTSGCALDIGLNQIDCTSNDTSLISNGRPPETLGAGTPPRVLRDETPATERLLPQKIDHAMSHRRRIDEPAADPFTEDCLDGTIQSWRDRQPFRDGIMHTVTRLERCTFISPLASVPHFFSHDALQRLKPGDHRREFFRPTEYPAIQRLELVGHAR
jgi:hypothetical protein